MIYGRTKFVPSTCQKWKDTLKFNSLPQLLTASSFSNNATNSDLVRLKSASPPFVRDGINFTPTLMNPKTAAECFEGNAKIQWLDQENYWCHLCQEPFSNANIHIGEREHQCMSFFVYLYAMYPHRGERGWSAKQVLAEATFHGNRQKISDFEEGMSRGVLAKNPFAKFWVQEECCVVGGDKNNHHHHHRRHPAVSPIAQLGQHVRSDPNTIEPSHLFTMDDVQRYHELQSLIIFAATRDLQELAIDGGTFLPDDYSDDFDGHHVVDDDEKEINHRHDVNVESSGGSSSSFIESTNFIRASRKPTLLSHILQSKQQIPLHSQGEKMFKETLSRMIVEMFPALSPVSHTQLSHKCWGRTNEEMLYCRLELGRIQELVGGTPLTTKDQRAYMIRNLFWELIVATEFRCEDELDPVAVTIGREILRRISFELIYAMSMHFMNRAQSVVEMLGFPDVEDLAKYNSL